MSDAQPSFCNDFNNSMLSNHMIAKLHGGNCIYVDILDRETYETIANVHVISPMHDSVRFGRFLTLSVTLTNSTNPTTHSLFKSCQMDIYSDNITRLLAVLHKHSNLELYRNKYYYLMILLKNQWIPLDLIKYLFEFLYCP